VAAQSWVKKLKFQLFDRQKFMLKRNNFDSSQIMYRTDKLMKAASNRYKITVQVANRAKRNRYSEIDSIDDPLMKPAIRAIIELSDELALPQEIIPDEHIRNY
jgi:DNA-directed RNA polymerase subunit omega